MHQLTYPSAVLSPNSGAGEECEADSGAGEVRSYCKEPGHIRDDCCAKHPERKPKRYRSHTDEIAALIATGLACEPL